VGAVSKISRRKLNKRRRKVMVPKKTNFLTIKEGSRAAGGLRNHRHVARKDG
jgi:hypothetical protein